MLRKNLLAAGTASRKNEQAPGQERKNEQAPGQERKDEQAPGQERKNEQAPAGTGAKKGKMNKRQAQALGGKRRQEGNGKGREEERESIEK